MSVWINGRRGGSIRPLDRGLHYGDGLFETMCVTTGRIRLLELHLDRLLGSCQRLSISTPSRRQLRTEIARGALRMGQGVLKLIVTRGAGKRGYRIPVSTRPMRLMIAERTHFGRTAAMRTPARLRICRTRLGTNPALAGLKTLNRLESVLARSEWHDQRIAEGLMRDMDGFIVCGTMSNVFVRQGRRLLTPLLDRCGVAGVMRRWVMISARDAGFSVREMRLDLPMMMASDEVFLTNAVVGMWPVAGLFEGRILTRFADFSAASALRTMYEAL